MYKIIPLESHGSTIFTVDMGNNLYIFNTKYNYKIEAWVLDISDINENLLIGGIVLKPNIDLLKPYPQLKKSMGALVIVEKVEGYYKNTDSLGTDVVMLWYPFGEEIEIPV